MVSDIQFRSVSRNFTAKYIKVPHCLDQIRRKFTGRLKQPTKQTLRELYINSTSHEQWAIHDSNLPFFYQENQRPNVIGKILEHLSSPEELFKHYPSRPEVVSNGLMAGYLTNHLSDLRLIRTSHFFVFKYASANVLEKYSIGVKHCMCSIISFLSFFIPYKI